MEVAKVLRGIFIRDGATAVQKQIEAKATSSLVLGVRSTEGGNELTGISSSIDSSGNNRLLVDIPAVTRVGLVKPSSTQTVVWGSVTLGNNGATVYTVSTGKTFYCTGLWLGSNGAVNPILQINGAGLAVAHAYPTSGATGCVGTSLSGGILFTATTGQTIKVTGGGVGGNTANVWGWEE